MTFIRQLLNNSNDLDIEPEEIKIDERPLHERHAETVNVLLSRLYTTRAQIEKEIADAQRRLASVCRCIHAYEEAATVFETSYGEQGNDEPVPPDPRADADSERSADDVSRALREIRGPGVDVAELETEGSSPDPVPARSDGRRVGVHAGVEED